MKKTIKIFIGAFLIVSLFGCSEDYFDVDKPSTAVNVEDLRMNDILGPVIFHTVKAQYYAERSLGNYSQYITGQGGGAIGKTSASGAWTNIYLYAIPNLKVILSKAEEKNAKHFSGVAKVLMAMNIALATDMWDWIPYSEAGQGVENLQPAFNSQQDIYNEIDTLLAQAITELQGADDSGISIGIEDLIYNGNIDNWIKAAYTLRARYALHLSKKNGAATYDTALSYLANGFSSNDDDFQMSFEEKNMNPWFAREILARATSNDHDKIGDQIVSYMNGTSYPFVDGVVSIDPRLPAFAENGGDITDPWRGFMSGGDGESSDGEDANVNFKDGGVYTTLDAPIVMISYAEALFIKAEAEFIKNGGNTTSTGSNANAYDAYINGITASMDKMGVSGADYIADAAISVTNAGLKLEHIMKEKYIANFLTPETYNDLRRYDFSTDVYRDLALPVSHLESEYPNEWMVRASYPDSEEARNPTNVNAHKQAPTVPVWWDE